MWYFNLLRVEKDLEIRGIDIQVHGEPAYPNAAYGHGWDNEGEFSLDFLENPSAGHQQAQRRTVKALINPHKRSNWNDTDKINKGGALKIAFFKILDILKNLGLIEMTIAEQQKTLSMFAKMAERPKQEKEEPYPVEGLFPVDCLKPLKDSGLGTGKLNQKMENLKLRIKIYNYIRIKINDIRIIKFEKKQ